MHTYRGGKQIHIAVVDDSRSVAMYISNVMSSLGYAVQTYTDSIEALKKLQEAPPDLILLDIEMPGLNGYELCTRLKTMEMFKDTPVIFVTTLTDTDIKVKGFSLGARDYITKPFHNEELIARVKTHLELSFLQKQQDDINQKLEQRVNQQVKEIATAQMGTITALATLAEHRDEDTGTHLFRVSKYCRILGTELIRAGKYAITPDYVDVVSAASPLHDIGKVAIPDAILLKPGRLTPDEFDIIKTHTTIGADTLKSVIGTNSHNRYLSIGAEIAMFHHEKWDGSGYPHGLAGQNIPLSGRIMAIADVYDALRSKRCYKPEFTHEKACGIIEEGTAAHFDPVLVDLFIHNAEQFKKIWDSLAG